MNSKFNLRQKVFIDNDKSLIAFIVAIMISSEGFQYKLGWIHNGEIKEFWIDEWRLTNV